MAIILDIQIFLLPNKKQSNCGNHCSWSVPCNTNVTICSIIYANTRDVSLKAEPTWGNYKPSHSCNIAYWSMTQPALQYSVSQFTC